MKKKSLAIIMGALMALSVVGCGSAEQSAETAEAAEVASSAEEALVEASEEASEASTEEAEYSEVTIDNYNLTTTYSQKPEKVVCLSLNSAEIIAALGEADSVMAIQNGNNTVADLLPEYAEALKDVDIPESINTGMPPTLEAMLELAPDLVAMNGYYFYVPFFGAVEDYQNNNINLYVTEGSYVENCSIENTYNDILNLGKIFGKEAKAQELVDGMKQSFADVESKVKDAEKVDVMAFDSISEDGLYTIAGGVGLEEELLEMAGANNVFADVESDFSTVSIEEIVERNPQYIIIHEYTNAENDAQTKIDALKAMKELSDVDAVKNDNFIVVKMMQVTPGLQNVDFVESVADAIH
ncbi:MAG: ABC transporter substrate-binding protein [Butyrivibrio sp.]|nr:ABC transporter substrate-binding protein [Butyrivibrio sp.]